MTVAKISLPFYLVLLITEKKSSNKNLLGYINEKGMLLYSSKTITRNTGREKNELRSYWKTQRRIGK